MLETEFATYTCLGPSELRIYNSQEKKLDPRTISGYFIRYAERSKGYRFYCPPYSTRIGESRNAKFLENDLINGSDKFEDIVSEKDHYEGQPFGSSDRLIFIRITQVQPSVSQLVHEVSRIVDIDPTDNVANEEILEQPIEQYVDQKIPRENDESILRQELRNQYS